MAGNVNVVRSGFSRVWLVPNRAGSANTPEYQGLWKAGAVGWKQGDVKTIRVPDPSRYDQFIRVGKIIGDPGDPQLPITARYTTDLSRLLQLVKRGCDHDLQVHIGECNDPRDFNRGWTKVLILEGARPTDYKTGDLGALEPGQRAMVDEDVPFTGEDYYEVGRMGFGEQAAAQVTQEIVDVLMPDTVQCGSCGIVSDGCQVILALTKRAGGSPGTGADIVYTKNGGGTWSYREITTLTGSNDPNALDISGSNLFVVSAATGSLMYCTLADLLNNAETWTAVTTGFGVAATTGPKAIYAFDPTHVWIVGKGGYIYFSSDITAGVTAQDSGTATAQDYSAIHGIDQLHIVAVGAANAVSYTANGGSTWSAITGPAVGVALNAVWMKSNTEWFIGTDGGKLFVTRDAGTSWTEVTFPGSGAGHVYDLNFATNSVGFMAHTTAAPRGRILRTIDGGHSWYVAPESGVTLVNNNKIEALDSCDPNVVIGGGLASNGTDGFLVKGAA